MGFGAYAIAAAVVCWSLDLLLREPARRSLGSFGLLLGILQLIWQMVSQSDFGLHNMQLFWLWLTVWLALVAYLIFEAQARRSAMKAKQTYTNAFIIAKLVPCVWPETQVMAGEP
jgi:hypothetical protein